MLISKKMVMYTGLIILVVTLVAICSPSLSLAVDQPQVEWIKNYGSSGREKGYSMCQTTDGGYIIAGNSGSKGAGNQDIWLFKTDSSGNLIWDKTYGGSQFDYSYSICPASDSGYILVGRTNSYGSGDYDLYILKVDENGNLEWGKTIGGPYFDCGYSICEANNGGYLICGRTNKSSTGNSDGLLIRIDSNGEQVWMKTLGGASDDILKSVHPTPDGGYILVGSTRSYGVGGFDMWLVKVDIEGNEEWQQTFGGIAEDYGESVIPSLNDGYILTGSTNSSGIGNFDIWLVKTDTVGNIEWDKTFGSINHDSGKSICQVLDGGYIITGSTSSTDVSDSNAYLLRLDVNGNLEWEKTFGGTDWDEGEKVIIDKNGDYIITGETASHGDGSVNAWLIKVHQPGYTLKINSSNGGSTSPEAGVIHCYTEGEEVNLIAYPETGYRFVCWTGDVDTVDDTEASNTTIL